MRKIDDFLLAVFSPKGERIINKAMIVILSLFALVGLIAAIFGATHQLAIVFICVIWALFIHRLDVKKAKEIAEEEEADEMDK